MSDLTAIKQVLSENHYLVDREILEAAYCELEEITRLKERVEVQEEFIRELASKLESQVVRNPSLPESYKTLVKDAFGYLNNAPQ